MSSSPTALFSTPEKAAHPEKFSSGLCTSFLPSGIEKTFIREMPEHQLRISVRPFCVATDIPILFKWISQEYAGPLLTRSRPPQELEESYTSMIESDFAQPFMGLVNDIPVCQMDIYRMQQDVLSLSYPTRPGDYGLQLVIAPLAVQDNMLLLLQACLEYFFSFAEVGRIIVNIEEGNEYNRQLFKKAGFRSLYDIRTAYRSSSLYGLIRHYKKHCPSDDATAH
ncbi:MAG TPA: GNAT family N-acetyltransferase [Puia sp.]|nr:GNAT family N-acetyltransferase [Puia sp.]